jgi:uncharacterized repeat protein (TIGR01451 family)
LKLSKRAQNVTRGVDATTVAAEPGDLITYTLVTENRGNAPVQLYSVEDPIHDILELAELQTFMGAVLNYGNNSLKWEPVDIGPGGKVEKTFTVKVRQSPTIKTSDYVMTNVYGNTVNVNVKKPFVSPPTGSPITLSLALSIMATAGFVAYKKGFRLPIAKYLGIV